MFTHNILLFLILNFFVLCLFQIFYDQESEALLSHNCSSHVQKVEAGAAKTHPIEWNSGKGYKSSKHITNLVHKINLKIVPENILEFVRLLPKYSLPHPTLFKTEELFLINYPVLLTPDWGCIYHEYS